MAPLEQLEDLDVLFQKGASDLHFIPQRQMVTVALRSNAQLEPLKAMNLEAYRRFLQKVKLRANLDISEKRLPQDGSFKTPSGQNYRVSTMASIHGEALTLRSFGQGQKSLEELGLTEGQFDALTALLKDSFSMLLISGQTGSGKSTTLKAILTRLATGFKKVVSVEDPVEVSLPGVLEISIKEGIGLDYEAAVFASLRQDPDYLAVGEIRDKATCRHCLKAALSGHPLITTIHGGGYETTRLRLSALSDMPEYVDHLLTAVLHQNLVPGQGGAKLEAKLYIKKGEVVRCY